MIFPRVPLINIIFKLLLIQPPTTLALGNTNSLRAVRLTIVPGEYTYVPGLHHTVYSERGLGLQDNSKKKCRFNIEEL